jgi:hypothetical protein
MAAEKDEKEKKSLLRVFLDFFVLFSGVSTRSNLSRTQPRPVRSGGLFLFRTPGKKDSTDSTDKQ